MSEERSRQIVIAGAGIAGLTAALAFSARGAPVKIFEQASQLEAAGADPYGNDRIAFELSTTVDRREFGLNWQNALPNGGDAVAWDVTLTVDLQLVA